MKKHPTDLHLEALYLEQDRERRRMLLHVAGCPRCLERIAEIQRRRPAEGATPDSEEPDRGGREPGPDDLAGPFVLMLRRERLDAPELFLDLLRQPPEHRAAYLLSNPRLHTWGFFELLVERSLETATRDPGLAEELGLLALGLSDRLQADLYGADVIEDLRGRAWAYVANARRVRSDLV